MFPTGMPDFRARAMQPALSGPEAEMSTKAVTTTLMATNTIKTPLTISQFIAPQQCHT
ncbi:hypothetical protein D3C72_2491640 [compost metagenome]